MRSAYDWIGRLGLLLAIIGALNWGLVGLFEWNLVAAIFGGEATLTATMGERIIYVLVGIGGLIAIPMLAATLRRGRTGTGYGTGAARDDEMHDRRRRAA
jgi:hypothetical protein